MAVAIHHVPFGQRVGCDDHLLDADDDGLHVVARGDQQRPQILVPAVDEEDDEQRGDVGRDSGSTVSLKEAERPAPSSLEASISSSGWS
jgi:hypothetical protein